MRWVLLALAFAGCTTAPATDPDVRGVITAITDDGRYRIESSSYGPVIVRVNDETAKAGSEPLAVGSDVSVWFTGPVMKSYPPQAIAARIETHANTR